jgi:outer membrane protein TolC
MTCWTTTTIVALSLASTGCRDFGRGGTGELVIPKRELREIESTELQPAPATGPATQVASTRPSTQPLTEIPLAIEEARQMALANNLDLKVDLLEPTISRQFLGEEVAQFESTFTADVNYSVLDQPTNSRLSGSEAKDFNATPGLRIPLLTGGVINLAVPLERFETNNQFSTLNPSYSSDVSASISQPLLRGAGVDANAHGIRVAFYDYQISQARTKLEVIRVLAAADRAYWRVYAARKELEVRKKEYDLAAAQLERARRQVRAGVAADVEIVRAESGVADAVEAIIISDNNLRDRQRELKRILNQPGLEMDSATAIGPATPPIAVPFTVDADRLIATALTKRMEMLELELRIAQETANVGLAKNGMLPIATLDYQYNVNGLGSSFDDSFNMVADKNFEDHRLGVHVEVPIGNEAARSRYRRAIASRQQQLATKEQRTLAIKQEVFNAADQLEANWQRILASRQRVVLAARVLNVEIRQFEQGLRTSTDVLDAQTRLANAQSDEINAITEYQISQIDIAFASGMLLGRSHVAWEPTRSRQ